MVPVSFTGRLSILPQVFPQLRIGHRLNVAPFHNRHFAQELLDVVVVGNVEMGPDAFGVSKCMATADEQVLNLAGSIGMRPEKNHTKTGMG